MIGTDVVDAFFGQMEPLGKTILVDNHPVQVVGVAEHKGRVLRAEPGQLRVDPDHDLPQVLGRAPLAS